jgi:hypothetical protein
MDEWNEMQADAFDLDDLIVTDRGHEILPALRAKLARLTAGLEDNPRVENPGRDSPTRKERRDPGTGVAQDPRRLSELFRSSISASCYA